MYFVGITVEVCGVRVSIHINAALFLSLPLPSFPPTPTPLPLEPPISFTPSKFVSFHACPIDRGYNSTNSRQNTRSFLQWILFTAPDAYTAMPTLHSQQHAPRRPHTARWQSGVPIPIAGCDEQRMMDCESLVYKICKYNQKTPTPPPKTMRCISNSRKQPGRVGGSRRSTWLCWVRRAGRRAGPPAGHPRNSPGGGR